MRPTFKSFLLNEDAAADVLNLQMQLTQLQARKANQDKTIDTQIMRIQNLLAQKQKLLANQNKQAQAQTPPAAPTATPAPGATPNAGQTQ